MINKGKDNSRFIEAVAFAADTHAEDFRKGTTIPYLSHLLQVAGLAYEFGANEDEAIGALLHDAAEDAGGEAMLEQIDAKFGPLVAGIVRENSDSLAEIGAEKAPWKQRKIDYLKGIETKSKSALLVSLSDKVHNTRALIADTRNVGESHWNRFNAEKSELLWYYQSLAESFEARKEDYPELKPAIAELSFAVKTLHSLAS